MTVKKRTVEIEEEDFEAIRDAVMETPRGRWFLEEFSQRVRLQDARRVLDALGRLERTVHDIALPFINITQIRDNIAVTRQKIAILMAKGDPARASEIEEHRIFAYLCKIFQETGTRAVGGTPEPKGTSAVGGTPEHDGQAVERSLELDTGTIKSAIGEISESLKDSGYRGSQSAYKGQLAEGLTRSLELLQNISDYFSSPRSQPSSVPVSPRQVPLQPLQSAHSDGGSKKVPAIAGAAGTILKVIAVGGTPEPRESRAVGGTPEPTGLRVHSQAIESSPERGAEEMRQAIESSPERGAEGMRQAVESGPERGAEEMRQAVENSFESELKAAVDLSEDSVPKMIEVFQEPDSGAPVISEVDEERQIGDVDQARLGEPQSQGNREWLGEPQSQNKQVIETFQSQTIKHVLDAISEPQPKAVESLITAQAVENTKNSEEASAVEGTSELREASAVGGTPELMESKAIGGISEHSQELKRSLERDAKTNVIGGISSESEAILATPETRGASAAGQPVPKMNDVIPALASSISVLEAESFSSNSEVPSTAAHKMQRETRSQSVGMISSVEETEGAGKPGVSCYKVQNFDPFAQDIELFDGQEEHRPRYGRPGVVGGTPEPRESKAIRGTIPEPKEASVVGGTSEPKEASAVGTPELMESKAIGGTIPGHDQLIARSLGSGDRAKSAAERGSVLDRTVGDVPELSLKEAVDGTRAMKPEPVVGASELRSQSTLHAVFGKSYHANDDQKNEQSGSVFASGRLAEHKRILVIRHGVNEKFDIPLTDEAIPEVTVPK